MEETNQSGLRISIDTQRGIVRIHRSILKILNDPVYVRLLIDKENCEAAIQAANSSDRDKIETPDFNKPFRFQINSKALTESLANIVGWKQNAIYRLNGVFEDDYVLFDLTKAVEKIRGTEDHGRENSESDC